MVTIQCFDLSHYNSSIEKLEKRREELLRTSSSLRDFDVAQRLCLIEEEIKDLHDIVSYLSSPVPRSKVFLD